MSAKVFDTICKTMIGRPEYREKCAPTKMLDAIQKKSKGRVNELTVFDPFVSRQQLQEQNLGTSIKKKVNCNFTHLQKSCG